MTQNLDFSSLKSLKSIEQQRRVLQLKIEEKEHDFADTLKQTQNIFNVISFVFGFCGKKRSVAKTSLLFSFFVSGFELARRFWTTKKK